MHVLSVGEDSATVDYSKLPAGVDAAYIRQGLDKALDDMKARGWNVRMCLISPDPDAALAAFRQMLAAGAVDVILFGGGLRMPPERVELFEALINEARRSAPHARFAFDNDPHEGADAVARQVTA